jgi:HD superfamily phosphodiesterase
MEYPAIHQYMLRKLELELPTNLYYHGVHHTVDVLESAGRIAIAEKLTEGDFILLQTAVLLHDAGYIERYNDNEIIACDMARQILPGFDYNAGQIDLICGLIMATAVDFEPQTHLQQVICDADHDYFGRADYKRIAATLYRELTEYGRSYNEREWVLKQIHFLTARHKYYTAFALREREPGKQKNIRKLQEKLEGL